ncbi:ATP-binding protein [Streptomyces sp. NBC_00237]|uniref:ATP-binding protein n=1 Tax=Streptomyces sp. NBC_00237 TaxID=2975687 RepID=UPI002255A255|nr:ATP-binding protein [Streptomyces sp. NBC_00237]MCX5206515.1 ATP-binding protein [Streptomyces sp. NBC_00237]
MNSKQLIQQTATSRATSDLLPGPVRGWGIEGVANARRAARAFTAGLSPAPAEDAADSLVLVVSELVTNAVRHGGGRYTLAFSATFDTLTVAVGDPSPELPRERIPDIDDSGGGFGWHLVQLLAQEVTIVPARSPRPRRAPRFSTANTAGVLGKTIRAVLPR